MLLTMLLALASPSQGPDPKALVLFFDGLLPGAITPALTPNLHALLDDGAWSLRARCEDTTISGSGWSTFLTGVHRDKHQVPDNAFTAPNFGPYPLFFQRLRELRPGTVCAIAQSWRPIERHLVAPAEPDFSFYAEYDLTSRDFFDEFSVDAMCAETALLWLQQRKMDCVVVMFADADGVGHLENNAYYDASDPLYQRKIAELDAHVGRLVAAVREREKSRLEYWLIAVHTDHAGARGEGHGLNLPSHRDAPFILNGYGIVRGEIWPPPKSPDLVANVLRHFAIEAPDPAWGLDGSAVGFTATGPELAWFHRNLLVNGDAEAERGFSAESGVDASVFGWNDPGAVTVLRRADGSQVFSAPVGAEMHQRLDLLPLMPWIRDGRVAYEHSKELTLREVEGSGGRFVDAVLRLDAGAEADDLRLEITPLDRRALPAWQPLFDGASLAGWTPVNVDPDTFTVRDEMIVCSGSPTGELRSERMFENFIAEFEYRHMNTGGNGGFFVWSDALPAVGSPFLRAVEVQIIDGWETANWTSHGDVFAIWGATMKPDRPHPAGWERCLPSQRRANGAGMWNQFRVVAVDGVIQLWVNGQPVSGGSAVSPRKGYLCLESEGSELHFRKLRILELPSTGAHAEETAADAGGFTQVALAALPEGWRREDWKLVAAAGAAPLRSATPLAAGEIFYDWKSAEEKWRRVTVAHPGGTLELAVPDARGGELANLFHRTAP